MIIKTWILLVTIYGRYQKMGKIRLFNVDAK